jgi:manganese transport protein
MRRLVTRFINTIPTTIAILLGLNPLIILVYSQVALSLLLPLSLCLSGGLLGRRN